MIAITWVAVLLGLGLLSFMGLGLLLAVASPKTRAVGVSLLGVSALIVAGGVAVGVLAGWSNARVRLQQVETKGSLPPSSSLAAGEAFAVYSETPDVRDPKVADENEDDPDASFEIVYPEDRPAWVDAPPTREGDFDVVAVSSGPHYTRGQCRLALDDAVRDAVAEYVNSHLGTQHAEHFISISDKVDAADQYDEEVNFSFGPMKQSHALLQFDDHFRRQVERDWKDTIAAGRLLKTGFGVGGLLVVIALFFTYLRVDTATRGYYTGRLRLGAATTILTLVAGGAAAAHWLDLI